MIGSGTHASGYLVSLANHLFQSPIAYYRGKAAYDIAPGYETESDPDFTRPVKPGCLFCHAGSFTPVSGTINEYAAQPFLSSLGWLHSMSWSCRRPIWLVPVRRISSIRPGSRLTTRDSVCEQCHLKGVTRVPTRASSLRTLSSASRWRRRLRPTVTQCRVASNRRSRSSAIQNNWRSANANASVAAECGAGPATIRTTTPPDAVPYYRSRCLNCHANTHYAASHPSRTSNCIGCHMPKKRSQ